MRPAIPLNLSPEIPAVFDDPAVAGGVPKPHLLVIPYTSLHLSLSAHLSLSVHLSFRALVIPAHLSFPRKRESSGTDPRLRGDDISGYCDCSARVDWSIVSPGPMVLETEIRFM
jgi:hypothetical protein